jgi:hypothetical protein
MNTFKVVRMAKRGDKLPLEFKQEWIELHSQYKRTSNKVVVSMPTSEKSPFDGFAAMHYSNAAKAKETLADHPGRQEVLCEEFVSGERLDAAKTLKSKDQVKVVRLIIRKKDLSLAQFKDHWLKNYSKLEKRLTVETPVLRVVASFAVPPEAGANEPDPGADAQGGGELRAARRADQRLADGRGNRPLAQSGDKQPQQLAQLGDAGPRIGPRRSDPPAQRSRIDEEDIARDERRVLLHPRLPDQRLDAVDQALADAVEGRGLLAARIEGQLLQQDPRQRRLLRQPAIVDGEYREQLLGERLPRARRRERHVGSRVELLVEDQEHEIALVLGVVEQRAEADVRAPRDLAHGRRAIAMAGEELGGCGADALARRKLFLFS